MVRKFILFLIACCTHPLFGMEKLKEIFDVAKDTDTVASFTRGLSLLKNEYENLTQTPTNKFMKAQAAYYMGVLNGKLYAKLLELGANSEKLSGYLTSAKNYGEEAYNIFNSLRKEAEKITTAEELGLIYTLLNGNEALDKESLLKGLKYSQESYNYYKKINPNRSEPMAYFVGKFYYSLYTADPEKSEEYLRQAVTYSQEDYTYKVQQGVNTVKDDLYLGSLYFLLGQKLGDKVSLNKALNYQQNAYNVLRDLNDDAVSQVATALEIGVTHYTLSGVDAKNALEHLKQAKFFLEKSYDMINSLPEDESKKTARKAEVGYYLGKVYVPLNDLEAVNRVSLNSQLKYLEETYRDLKKLNKNTRMAQCAYALAKTYHMFSVIDEEKAPENLTREKLYFEEAYKNPKAFKEKELSDIAYSLGMISSDAQERVRYLQEAWDMVKNSSLKDPEKFKILEHMSYTFGKALLDLGKIYLKKIDSEEYFPKAKEYLEKAYELLQDRYTPLTPERAFAAYYLGMLRSGDYSKAETYLQEAYNDFKRLMLIPERDNAAKEMITIFVRHAQQGVPLNAKFVADVQDALETIKKKNILTDTEKQTAARELAQFYVDQSQPYEEDVE